MLLPWWSNHRHSRLDAQRGVYHSLRALFWRSACVTVCVLFSSVRAMPSALDSDGQIGL